MKQRLIAASALLCGRMSARLSDLWVLKHIWETEEQREVLQSLVEAALAHDAAAAEDHPRARAGEPRMRGIARDLEAITTQMPQADATEASYLRDRLGILDGRCQWVAETEQREFLTRRVAEAVDAVWTINMNAGSPWVAHLNRGS